MAASNEVDVKMEKRRQRAALMCDNGVCANRTAHRHGAAVLASLRNLTNGIYELAKERGRTAVDTLKSWCQQQTFTTVWPLLQH